MTRSLSLLLCLLAAPIAAFAADDLREPLRPAAVTRVIPAGTAFDQEISGGHVRGDGVELGNLVHMTFTNYGFYGNNFFSREASLEYPANRGIEHMVRGGLWVGGLATDGNGSFIGVTTGTVDAAQGPTSPEASEFTPSGKQILVRSTLPKSKFFSGASLSHLDSIRCRARSELDMVADFDDLTPTLAASNTERHRSMNIQVHQENYQWNFAEFRNVLFMHIEVKNLGSAIDSMWIGVYEEFASGNKAGYVNWPPSSTDAGGLGSFFGNKWNVWDPAYHLLREHYCDQLPLPPGPTNCHLERAPYWIGLRYLGSRGIEGDATTRQTTIASWNWLPGKADRDEDRERYRLMALGTIADVGADSLKPGNGDPVTLYAVGPFPVVPGDATVSADFAIVGGAEAADIQANSEFAQFAYDHCYVLPVPPPSPLFHVVARDTALDLYWDDSSESACDVTSPNSKDFEGYRVRISGDDPDSLLMLAQFDAAGDTASYNTGFDEIRLVPPVNFGEVACHSVPAACGSGLPPTVVCDTVRYHYKYSVHGLRNGFKYYCAVTAFDQGNSQIGPLESGIEQNRAVAIPGPTVAERKGRGPSVFPNPYRVEAMWDRGLNVRDHFLWFTNLPARCKLKIFTLSGDLVFEKDFDGATYAGEGARGIYDPSKTLSKPTLSGTTYGWNLITREGQAVATGLYLFSVEDRGPGGKTTVGKFLIVKADREGF
jgi:hypothetical protein